MTPKKAQRLEPAVGGRFLPRGFMTSRRLSLVQRQPPRREAAKGLVNLGLLERELGAVEYRRSKVEAFLAAAPLEPGERARLEAELERLQAHRSQLLKALDAELARQAARHDQ
jgi:hypothetical protein